MTALALTFLGCGVLVVAAVAVLLVTQQNRLNPCDCCKEDAS